MLTEDLAPDPYPRTNLHGTHLTLTAQGQPHLFFSAAAAASRAGTAGAAGHWALYSGNPGGQVPN
ncbi:hypothetical protein CGCA056_v000330 [Colletotrichum aenigma]|uniref:uncharacterized protein n=1 Tax=Colletotrichum aenigma TaxID=1215731 RepID=UPI001872792A|nr:uncharacterized protein CGCA056_v000330 [Colletotrichum aenigma]KAF5528656.1 hypothetical protein CGCA056_v000330 [Colletotrichum aenigma]